MRRRLRLRRRSCAPSLSPPSYRPSAPRARRRAYSDAPRLAARLAARRWFDGLITFTAFVVLGAIPLVGYALAKPDDDSSDHNSLRITVGGLCALLSYCLLGWCKSQYSRLSFFAAARETCFVGVLVLALAALTGLFVHSVAGDEAGSVGH